MTHNRKPATKRAPRALNQLNQQEVNLWLKTTNAERIAALDREIRLAMQNGGSTVFSQFAKEGL